MKDFFLALIAGQWFCFDKQHVVGVAAHQVAEKRIYEEQGKRFLPLPNSASALICDLQPFLSGGAFRAKHSHYLVLRAEDQLIALTMNGKGRMVMTDDSAFTPLPPAFSGLTRELSPEALVNGQDVLIRIQLDVLLKLMEKIARLRKKKQRLARQTHAGGATHHGK